MRLRLFYLLSVLVHLEADDNIHESSETNNPTTPIQTKRSAESLQCGEISPAVFNAQEIRTAEGTKNIINTFSTPGGTLFQYELDGTPVGGESSEQRRARKKTNAKRTESFELRASAKKGHLPSIQRSTEKKKTESARKAAERAAAPPDVIKDRKQTDAARHAAASARQKYARQKAETDALRKLTP